MKFYVRSSVLRLSFRFSSKQSTIFQILMDELGRETESSRSLSSDYLQNAIEFLPLQYTRMSTTTDTLGTGRVQNYVEETVPTYSDPMFKAHFRMSRTSFEVSKYN